MNRALSILFAALLVGLVIVMAATEQNHLVESVQLATLVVNVTAQVLSAVGMFVYCGFAALHSTQYISSPKERSMWLVVTIVLNVFGSCWYFVTTYQSFRKIGKGRLMALGNSKHA
jgi:hypothetical protein